MAFTYSVAVSWSRSQGGSPPQFTADRLAYLNNLYSQGKIDAVLATETVTATDIIYTRKYLDEATADGWITFITNLATTYGRVIDSIDKKPIDDNSQG